MQTTIPVLHLRIVESFNAAVARPENRFADGSINWNFVEGDIFMDLEDYAELAEEIDAQFCTLADEYKAVQALFLMDSDGTGEGQIA